MNTVPKGTNRPAAAARTRKHAQRTPLPPRPGQVEAAKATTVSEDLARMTVPQLRQLARDRGLSTINKLTRKPELLAALTKALTMKAEQVAQRTARTLAGEMPAPGSVAETAKEFGRPARQRGAKPQTPVVGPRTQRENFDAAIKLSKELPNPNGNRSQAKAKAFIEDAHKLGWIGQAFVEGEHVRVTVKRGNETIDIEWVSGVFQGTCVYSFDGRSVKLNNASAAKKRMARSAEEATEEVARASANRIVRKSAPEPKTRAALPFTEASLDQEVIDAVEGRKITWVNSISGEEEHDYVPAPRQGKGARPTNTKITEGKRGRTLTFVGMGGFHDVLVSSIVAVTR